LLDRRSAARYLGVASFAPQLQPLEAAELAAAYATSRELVSARLAALKVPSADIDDLRQEVFLVALRKHPRLFDRDAAKAWLGKVCEYVALAHRRRAYRRHEVPGDLSETAAALWTSLPEAEPSEWAADRVHGALSRLGGRERELIALRVAADMPFRSLAELHDCDVKTVRKRFQTAVRRLQHQLVTEDMGEPTSVVESEPGSSWRLRRDSLTAAAAADSRGVALGAFERTLIVSWRGNFDDGALEQFLRFGEGMIKDRGPVLRCLGLVSPVWPAPRFEDRERLREALQFLDRYCDAFSLVGADHNYRLAEQILRGLGFLQQARYPFGSFNNVTDGAKWLVARERPRTDTGQARTLSLLQAVQAVHETQIPETLVVPSQAEAGIVCHGAESSLAAYSLGRLLVTSWNGPVTQAAVRFLIRVSDGLRAEQGMPLAHLSVVEPESPRPRFAERQRLLDIARCTKRNVGTFSFLARSSNQRLAEQIMRGMGFLVRSSLQLYPAKNETDAAQWLVQDAARAGMPLSVGADGVLDLLAKARRLRREPC